MLPILVTALMLAGVLRHRDDAKRLLLVLLMPLVLISETAAAEALKIASSKLPEKYDLFLYRADLTIFGFNPSFAIGHALQGSMLLAVSAWCYTNLMAVGLAIYFVHFIRSDGEPIRAFLLLVIGPLFGYALYYIVPACGPVYAFSSFPVYPADVGSATAHIIGPPNAMPSVHFSLGLFCFWLCRKWPVARLFTIPFALFVTLATLALGEHYAVDLIVGLPFAAACFLLSERRSLEATVCAGFVMASLLVFRFNPALIYKHATPARIFCLLTTVVTFYLIERTKRTAQSKTMHVPALKIPRGSVE
jgi:hypothetical protein